MFRQVCHNKYLEDFFSEPDSVIILFSMSACNSAATLTRPASISSSPFLKPHEV
jgi:hypothetical protein